VCESLRPSISAYESKNPTPRLDDSDCRVPHFSVIRERETREDQVVSGVSAGAADRTSASYRQEPQNESVAAVRGFLNASILSAGVWLLVGILIYWLT
jgi:hypothetical protein